MHWEKKCKFWKHFNNVLPLYHKSSGARQRKLKGKK